MGVEVAPEEVDALAQGGVLQGLEVGVALPEPLGLGARLVDQAGDSRELRIDSSSARNRTEFLSKNAPIS